MTPGHTGLPGEFVSWGQALPPPPKAYRVFSLSQHFFLGPKSDRGRLLTGRPCPGENSEWSLPKEVQQGLG